MALKHLQSPTSLCPVPRLAQVFSEGLPEVTGLLWDMSFLVQNLGERGGCNLKCHLKCQRWQIPLEVRNPVPPRSLHCHT